MAVRVEARPRVQFSFLLLAARATVLAAYPIHHVPTTFVIHSQLGDGLEPTPGSEPGPFLIKEML